MASAAGNSHLSTNYFLGHVNDMSSSSFSKSDHYLQSLPSDLDTIRGLSIGKTNKRPYTRKEILETLDFLKIKPHYTTFQQQKYLVLSEVNTSTVATKLRTLNI